MYLIVFCEGFNIVVNSSDIGLRYLGIFFNVVEKLNYYKYLMGYIVLYKKIDSNDLWKLYDVCGGWFYYYKIFGLKFYINYLVWVMLYFF